MKQNNHGFTLIEVLVAVVILAISLTALLKSTQNDISSTNYLLDKSIAMWLAETIDNEVQLGVLPTNPSRDPSQQLSRNSLNRDWQIAIKFKPTDEAHFYTMKIDVRQRERVLAHLEDNYYARKD